MTLARLQSATYEIANLIAEGRYIDALQRCSNSRLIETEIESVIIGYGRRLIQAPYDFVNHLDIVEVKGRSPRTWSVMMPLWTLEEGRSDLTLELTIADDLDVLHIELDDLRVL